MRNRVEHNSSYNRFPFPIKKYFIAARVLSPSYYGKMFYTCRSSSWAPMIIEQIRSNFTKHKLTDRQTDRQTDRERDGSADLVTKQS